MKVFKVIAVTLMLLLVGAVSAQAVEVAKDGRGQVLIFPYYNVNDPAGLAMNYFRIVNTSPNQGVGVKVRLRESQTSKECLDFYVCLSAQDEWKAWIEPKLDNQGHLGGALIIDADFNLFDVSQTGTPVYPDYRNPATIGIPEALGVACTEGYIEVISSVAWNDTPGQRTVADPEQCRAMVEGGAGNAPADALIGDLHLIQADGILPNGVRAANGGLFAYNAVALADWTDRPIEGVRLDNLIPDLSHGRGGVAAVNAALAKNMAYIMHTNAFLHTNAFPYQVPRPAPRDILPYAGQTDFLVLFPTKHLSFTDPAPFDIHKWDNNEHTSFPHINYSPPPNIIPRPFPWELNYVRIGHDGLTDGVCTQVPQPRPEGWKGKIERIPYDLTAPAIFPNTMVYWGNIEPVLYDQDWLDWINLTYGVCGANQLQEVVKVYNYAPAYPQGYVELLFNGTGGQKAAVVVKLEKITDGLQTWTHALEAQYQ